MRRLDGELVIVCTTFTFVVVDGFSDERNCPDSDDKRCWLDEKRATFSLSLVVPI